jgi:hypothetical protein
MKIMREITLLMLGLGAAAIVANPVAAQQLSAQQNAARNALITSCTKQSWELYRGQSRDMWRWKFYAPCVAAAGFQP